MDNNYKKTIQKRLSEDRQKLLDNLKQVPIVSVACQKTGISRASYYRWKSSDKDFSKEANKALHEGKQLINDLAESQLINAIKDQNMTGIIWWLRNNHPGYTNKIELTTSKTDDEKLSPEQEKLIEKALSVLKMDDDEKKGVL